MPDPLLQRRCILLATAEEIVIFNKPHTRLCYFVAGVAVVLAAASVSAGTEPLTFQELMKFRQIEDAVISKDGSWIAYELQPDRGEGEAVARSVEGDAEYRVERGGKPALSGDSAWFAAAILPTQKERDEAAKKKGEKKGKGKKDEDGPRNGLALVSLQDGAQTQFEEVESFAFSEDGRWIAWKHYKEEDQDDDEDDDEADDEDEKPAKDEDRPVGTTLVLRKLSDSSAIRIPHVMAYAFDEPSRYLVYTIAAPDGESNGIFVRRLGEEELPEQPLLTEQAGRYTQMTWAEKSSRLGFVAAVDDDLHDPGPADVWTWAGDKARKPKRLAASKDAPEGWRIPSRNELTWSKDGERLFFGYAWIDPVVEERRLEKKEEKREKREREKQAEAGEDDEQAEDDESFDPYDFEVLLKESRVDVWHGDDPRIIPNQKKRWDKTEKDRIYLAVGHIGTGKLVRLADRTLPDVRPSDNARAVLASSDLDYRRLATWDGDYADVYHVDLKTGERARVVSKLHDPKPHLSPGGRFVVFWNDRDWHLYDADDGTTRNLTRALNVSFADEDDDYPAPDPGYGVADWVEKDLAVLIYDKFDLWRFPTGGGDPVNLTAGRGREEHRRFRLVDLDPDVDHVLDEERLLLHGYHDLKKNDGFWETTANRAKLERLIEDDCRFRFLAKAEEADRLLYTRETYREFPDLRVAGLDLADGRKLTDANPQIDRFAWGEAELVEWTSADGIPLQGVLIRPGNYEEGKRYPVLVYFYRFFSQRLYGFNEPVVNHRPSFPVYASHGYAVLLPDVRFEIGRPGLSAVKALVPGVQKLVEMGVADPAAIGLHGHSWSGYQAAYIITQTNLFAAAVAGAPVSNMTSAYSGIRLGSGLARQFQYEQSQSRIGASMDAALPLYLENSPVFHARRIETPLLIQFGDQDEAVPWQQGIELYLAMRRLDKDVIFLQYRGEPHHLKQYGNKLDYSIKMKQFFDYHLKGAEAPSWITEGVPYRGE